MFQGLSLIVTALFIGWLSLIWLWYPVKEENVVKKFKNLVSNIGKYFFLSYSKITQDITMS